MPIHFWGVITHPCTTLLRRSVYVSKCALINIVWWTAAHLQNANRSQMLNTYNVIRDCLVMTAHTRKQLSWDASLLLFHNSLRQPIKSFGWWTGSRLHLTNEGWLWLTDCFRRPVTDCLFMQHLSWCRYEHQLISPSPPAVTPPSLFLSLLVSTNPRTRRLIIIEENRVQKRSTLCTLSTMSPSPFVTSSRLPNKWEHFISLANLIWSSKWLCSPPFCLP